jgi:hypothetical protein
MTDALALVEPHDSTVDAVVIDAMGRVRIELKHLAVYHTRAAEEYEIWSHRAVLEASSVDRVVVEGAANVPDSVDDATVMIGDSEMTDWRKLLVARPVTRIKLSFGSGRTIEIHCQKAKLTLEQAVRHLEDWTGPLFTSPPA